MFLLQAEWGQIAKIYGPLGVFCLALILLVWKVLLPYIKAQHEAHVAALQATISDARQERDYMRKRYDEKTEQFLEALKFQGEQTKQGFDEVVEALRRSRN